MPDPTTHQRPTHPVPRTRLLAVAGIVLVSVTWLILRPSGEQPDDAPPPNPPPTATYTPQPTSTIADPAALGPRNAELIETAALAGRDAAGARAAALSLLELGEQASTMSRRDVESLWRAVATPDRVDELVADNLDAYDTARTRFPDGAPTRYVPLASRVDLDRDEEHARVDLWFLLIIEIPDGPAAQAWTTGTYQLEWHDDRWLIADVQAIDGPTPALQAATQTVDSATLRSLLTGFEPA